MNHQNIAGIQTHNLAVAVGGVSLLHGVTIRLGADEGLSLIGPNGAGKSTLLRCMTGLLSPTDGEVLCEPDLPMVSLPPRERARICALVPQEMHFAVPFTVTSFLELSRYPERGSFEPLTARDREIIRSAVEMTGIATLLPRTVNTLSGGEKRLVLIAAALAQDPAFLFLDEPTAGLDPAHRLAVLRVLARYRRERRRSILMVTHDANDALLLGGAVVGLKHGAVALGPIAVADLTAEHLANLFDTPFIRIGDGENRFFFVPEATP